MRLHHIRAREPRRRRTAGERAWPAALTASVIAVAIAVPGSGVSGQAAGGATDSTRVVAIRAARLVDGTGGPALADPVVLVRGDRIIAVGTRLEVPPGAEIVDLGGATLLPGLIDLHTHLISPPGMTWEEELLKSTPPVSALAGAANARATLRAGFTTVRDMGTSWPYVDLALRDAINRGWVEGPRMIAAGAYVSPTGGAGDALQFSPYVQVPAADVLADNEDQVRLRARQHLKQGADFVKILATGAVFSRGAPPGAQLYSEQERSLAVPNPPCRLLREHVARLSLGCPDT